MHPVKEASSMPPASSCRGTGQGSRRLPRAKWEGEHWMGSPQLQGPSPSQSCCLPSLLYSQDLHGQRVPSEGTLKDKGDSRGWKWVPRKWRCPGGWREPLKEEGIEGWGGLKDGGAQRMGALEGEGGWKAEGDPRRWRGPLSGANLSLEGGEGPGGRRGPPREEGSLEGRGDPWRVEGIPESRGGP